MWRLMKAAFYGFLVGVLAGAGGYWYLSTPENADQIASAKQQILDEAERMKDTVSEQFKKLTTETIKEELSKTGAVVREKAENAGKAIADAAEDTRLTATVKAKFAKSKQVSALDIKVSTSEGLVTLSGAASSPEEIKTAISLALETDGVRKVVSTIEVAESEE